MLRRSTRNIFGFRTVTFLLLCGACSASGVRRTQPVFKCCSDSSEQSSEPIRVHAKDLIHARLASNKTAGDQDNLSGENESLEATECHPFESTLTSTISFHPDIPEADQGFYFSTGYFRSYDKLFAPNQYCIKKSTDNGYIVKTQPSTYCDENECIRKCCDPLEVYDLSTYGISKLQCVPSASNPWRPTLYSTASKSHELTTAYFKSEHPRSWCDSENVVLWSLRTIGNDRRSLFRIMKNGSVIMKNGKDWAMMNTSRICIDGAINFPGHFDENAKQTVYSGDELDTIIIECGPELAAKSDAPLVLYGIALAVSTVFQFATLVVNGLLWEKQNIHGWTLLGYITTMFLFYVSLLATFFYLYNYPDPDFVTENEILHSFCGIIAVISHFLYICTICWLTVISTDIFLTFRILKLTRTRSKNKMKFLIYLIFTIFVPSVIICVGVLLDINYGDDPETDIILPRYGWHKCFLDLNKAAWPYLFGPIGTLLALNCILYCATIFHMYQIQESTKFASANNSQVQKQRTKIRLFSKLFLLMGVSWILEVVTFSAFGTGANVPVIIGDMVNILQPVAIFVIFVCKKDILKSLGEKYSFVSKVFSSAEPEDSITSSSSSRPPKLGKLWNPVQTTKWFRSRINSTMTEISNLSNQSMKSNISINAAIDESPTPITSSSPLNVEMETSS